MTTVFIVYRSIMKKLLVVCLMLASVSTVFAEEVVFNAAGSFLLRKTTYSSAKARRFFGAWPSAIPMDVTYYINKSTCSGHYQGTWNGQPISAKINPCITASKTVANRIRAGGVSCTVRAAIQLDPIGDTSAAQFESYGQLAISGTCSNGTHSSANYGGGITYTRE